MVKSRQVSDMRKCRYEDLIDSYLLDKMAAEEQTDFEEHYFICRSCFEKMSERDEIIQILKKEGVFGAEEEAEGRGVPRKAGGRKRSSFLTPPRLAVVAVSAAAVLFALWFLLPRRAALSPEFLLSGDETVRGASVTPVTPQGGMVEAPAFIEWKSAGPGMQYRLSLSSGNTVLWDATTTETRAALPENVRAGLRAGRTYAWQVRAFKPDGTLAAMSARVKFKVLSKS